jgi:hypothetical protein
MINDEAAAAEETAVDSDPAPDAAGWTVPLRPRGRRGNWTVLPPRRALIICHSGSVVIDPGGPNVLWVMGDSVRVHH